MLHCQQLSVYCSCSLVYLISFANNVNMWDNINGESALNALFYKTKMSLFWRWFWTRTRVVNILQEVEAGSHGANSGQCAISECQFVFHRWSWYFFKFKRHIEFVLYRVRVWTEENTIWSTLLLSFNTQMFLLLIVSCGPTMMFYHRESRGKILYFQIINNQVYPLLRHASAL